MRSSRAALTLAVVLLCLATPAAAGQDRGPRLRILEPVEGATLPGGDVVVVLETEGVELGDASRNGAYVLLRLDRLPAVKSYTTSFSFRGVAEGEHVLVAELRRADGGRFSPEVSSTVSFRLGAARRVAP